MADKESYQGKEITIHFDGSKCIHSRNCVLKQPKVFRANVDGPWIQPDNASCEALVELVHACPSAAITYERHDGGPPESAPEVNTLHVRENGPYALSAELVIDDQRAGFRATLCRCGASETKPYCDGSHVKAHFAASGEPRSKATDALAERGGELKLSSLPDGPLQLNGNVEICAGTGRTVGRTTKTFLCRCGQSNNKPYCDGTHKKVGFRS